MLIIAGVFTQQLDCDGLRLCSGAEGGGGVSSFRVLLQLKGHYSFKILVIATRLVQFRKYITTVPGLRKYNLG
jgi:hypothetical protein